MFTFPKQSEFNRVVPKTKIYAHAHVSKRVKELFVSQVSEIVWRYKLSPETINLPARNGIQEIQVFDIHLKTPEVDDAVLAAIDKAIPFPLVFQLIYGHSIQTEVPYKRPSTKDLVNWVVEARFRAEWRAISAARDELPVALDLAGLYEQILHRHIPIPPRNGESLRGLINRYANIQKKITEKEALKARLKKEIQFNRKVEINAALRSLEAHIAEITAG